MSNSNFVEQLMERTSNTEKTAYVYRGSDISYSDLFQGASVLASSLKDWGIKPSDRVVLALYDTPAFTLTFLACIWVGAIPIPVNPMSKKVTLAHVLSDSEPRLVVTEADNTAAVKDAIKVVGGLNIKTVVQNIYPCTNIQLYHDECLKDWFSNSNQYQSYYTGPGASDYWQYTSGTTGKAKGVMHNCQGMIENTHLYSQQILNINSDSKLYSTAKMFFGYGLGANLFFGLWNSATTLIDCRWPDKEIILDNLLSFKPSHFFSVPLMYKQLDLHGECLVDGYEEKPVLISAGSPLPESIFSIWKNRYDLEILDGIGSTEVGHIFLSNRRGEAAPGYTGSVVPGYEVKLVDQEDASKEVSSRGILCVKGPSVARGYHNNPEKTSERFIDGWYNTGDLFDKAETGLYKYLGRNDDLFKVNGRWISPTEIEHFLLSNIKGVNDFVMLPKLDENGLERPCLFVGGDVADRKNEIKSEVVNLIKSSYSSYMIPKELFFMDALPRNENGKLLRHKLAEIVRDMEEKQAPMAVC